eukprot:9203964-Heterocapsa_arctica.AAC.1
MGSSIPTWTRPVGHTGSSCRGTNLFEPRHGFQHIERDVARRLSGPTPIRRWLPRIRRRVGLVLGWA